MWGNRCLLALALPCLLSDLCASVVNFSILQRVHISAGRARLVRANPPFDHGGWSSCRDFGRHDVAGIGPLQRTITSGPGITA
jgi:hypothetical protein